MGAHVRSHPLRDQAKWHMRPFAFLALRTTVSELRSRLARTIHGLNAVPAEEQHGSGRQHGGRGDHGP